MKPWPALKTLGPAKQLPAHTLGLDVWTRGGAERSGFWRSACGLCVEGEYVKVGAVHERQWPALRDAVRESDALTAREATRYLTDMG